MRFQREPYVQQLDIEKKLKHNLQKDAAEIAYSKLNEENDKVKMKE